MKYLTDKDPIKHINTNPTKEEVSKCVENAIYGAFRDTSTPCITKIKKALNHIYKS